MKADIVTLSNEELAGLKGSERRARVIAWLKKEMGEENYQIIVQGGSRAVAQHRAEGTLPKSVGMTIFGLQVTNQFMGVMGYAGRVLALEQWRASFYVRPEGVTVN